MSALRRWSLVPVTTAAFLALTILPFWPGAVAPVRASGSGRTSHAAPLLAPQIVPSRPSSVLGQVELHGFGRALAIVEGKVAVPSGSTPQINLYARSGNVFKLAGAVRPNGSSASGFGSSIGASGNEMIVGGRGAWMFMNTAQGWKQTGFVGAPGGLYDTEFGSTVDISGSYAIVGDITGHAYIYHASGSQWVRSADLSLPKNANGALFGNVVKIAGTTAFVNADQADQGGSVFIYSLEGTKWTQVAQVRGSDVTNGVDEVRSLAVSGNTLAIGMPGYSEAGRVYVFTNQSGAWKQTGELRGSDTRAGDQFGFHVSLSGSTLAVGAPEKANGGAVYVFSQSGGSWTQTHEYVGADEHPDDQLGTSTAVSDSLVVGEAPSHAGGAIYIFAPGIGTIPPAVPLKVNLAPQVYRRAPQIIGVRTLPNAHVDLKVIYPGGSAVRAAGTTDRAGFWRYGWIVRAGKAGTATVSIMVTSGSKRRHFTKHFKIL